MQAFLPMWFNRFSGKHNPGNTYTLGGMSDSYYEYLLKVWLLGAKKVSTMHRGYSQSMAFYHMEPPHSCERNASESATTLGW